MAIIRVASATSTRSGSDPDTTSLVVPAPAGIAANDVLVAFLTVGDDAINSITPPTGWTQIYFIDDSHSDSLLTSAAYYKVASASEPSTYTFVTGNAMEWGYSAVVQAWRGVNRTNPLDVAWNAASHHAVAASDSTPTNQPITTANPGAVVIVTAESWTGDSNYMSARPSGFTGGGDAFLSVCCHTAYQTAAAAGTVTPGSWTWAISNLRHSLNTIALRPDSGYSLTAERGSFTLSGVAATMTRSGLGAETASYTLTMPAAGLTTSQASLLIDSNTASGTLPLQFSVGPDAVADDVMLAIVVVANSAAEGMAIDGWEQLLLTKSVAGNNHHTVAVFMRVNTGTEPTEHMLTTTGNANDPAVVLAQVWRNISLGSVLDVAYSASSHFLSEPATAEPTNNSITTVSDGAVVLALAQAFGEAELSELPAGFTAAGSVSDAVSLHCGYLRAATPTSVAPGAWLFDTALDWSTLTLALRNVGSVPYQLDAEVADFDLTGQVVPLSWVPAPTPGTGGGAAGGFLESYPYSTRAKVNPSSIPLPSIGRFTMPPPWNTTAYRITNSSNRGGVDSICIGYSYFSRINNSAGQSTFRVYVPFTLRGGPGHRWFSVNKTTGTVTNMGNPFTSGTRANAHSGEFNFWHPVNPDLMVVPLYAAEAIVELWNVTTQTRTTIVNVRQLSGFSNAVIQKCHMSRDGKVLSIMLLGGSNVGTLIYWVEAANGNAAGSFRFIPRVANIEFDESQLDLSGNYLLVKEKADNTGGGDVDNIFFNVNTGTRLSTLQDNQGAGGHSDNGYDTVIAQDNFVAGGIRRWRMSQGPTSNSQGPLIYDTNGDWSGAGPQHISCRHMQNHTNWASQWALGAAISGGNPKHGNEIIGIKLDGSKQVLGIAPCLGNRSLSGRDDYELFPFANTDPTGRYVYWTTDCGSTAIEAFVVEVPYELLVGGGGGTPELRHLTLPATMRSYALEFFATDLVHREMNASGASFTLTGRVALFAHNEAPDDNYFMAAFQAEFTLSVTDVAFGKDFDMLAEHASFVLTGKDITAAAGGVGTPTVDGFQMNMGITDVFFWNDVEDDATNIWTDIEPPETLN